MLKVNFKSDYIGQNYNKNTNPITQKSQSALPKENNSKVIPFKGNIDFVLINKCKQLLPKDAEFKHISDVLRSLGVKELELGDNIDLARLIKSAMCRIKRLGFDVPTIIKCDAKYFDENLKLQNIIKDSIAKKPSEIEIITDGFAHWDRVNEPELYFNPALDWGHGNGIGTNVKDPRNTIYHETGHYLHMKNHKNNPMLFNMLKNIKLDPYQKEIVNKTIGLYGSENPVSETIPEIFSRLISGESYSELHPEIFHIYSKYNGPMPNKIKRK